MESVFWFMLALGIYPYAVYPLLVKGLAALRRQCIRSADSPLPTLTVVTSAFNEVRHIEATVRNKLEQDYPRESLSVIVVSDGSDDGTDEIVDRLAAADPRVRLIRQTPRQGKTAALNAAFSQARGEIVVVADANSMYRQDALRKLVRNFADREVGYVTGKMIYVNADGSLVGDGCSAFMKYENALREAETRVGSIVGVDGGIDAVRRTLYRPMRADQLPDFVLPLDVVEQGYRVVFEPEALLTEEALSTSASEYRMRVRVALRALWALWDKRALLNPFRSGLFAWQLGSHKLLRYLSFLPLAAAALLAFMLVPRGPLYMACAAGVVLFAAFALTAAVGPRAIGQSAAGRYCFYFFLLNWASAVAFVRFLRGEKQVLWQPRTG